MTNVHDIEEKVEELMEMVHKLDYEHDQKRPLPNTWVLSEEDLDLPVPRLELRWYDEEDNPSYPLRCEYWLVLEHFTGTTEAVVLGVTHTTAATPVEEWGDERRMRMPFRDSAHICHNAEQLNLPAYVTYEGEFAQIDIVNRQAILSS